MLHNIYIYITLYIFFIYYLRKETIVNLNFQINVKNKEISGLEEKNRNQENIYNESIKKLKRDFNVRLNIFNKLFCIKF